MECNYCNELKSRNYGNFIFQTDYWIVFLAPNQSNIGMCVIALKRHYGALAGINPEEWVDFGEIVQKLEHSLKKAFDATLFNWESLMNADHLQKYPDPHVHWHFIPRYNHKVELGELIFEDPDFGHMKPGPIRKIPDDIREKIIRKIKDNFN
jgi:diadenosine tetraphosphate (Ap4A) HIT family hydrolase